MYDIVIVGAGPAGATLARLLGKNFKILIIDRRQLLEQNPTSSFEKCCGGLLAPDAQQMLAKFGFGVPREILVGPQIFTVKTIDMQNNIENFYQRHYINVDREKFDKWLISLVPPKVDIQCNAVLKKFEETDSSITVQYMQQGKEHTVTTKILVGADGAFSKVRRMLGLNSQQAKTYISIQEYYKTQNSLPYFSSIFDDEITDFYSWTIPKDDILILGTAVLPNDKPYEKFRLLKHKLQAKGFEFGPCVKRNGAYLLRPEKLEQIHLGKERIPLIGEAAGWISPSSAEGISYAFRSALALADAIEQDPNQFLAQYDRNSRKLWLNIRMKLLKSPFMYNPNLRKMAMKSGLFSMNIIEQDNI